MSIRLLVVDDHPLLRMGVSQLVAGTDDIDVVGEATCRDARTMIDRTGPTVVAVGVRAPRAVAIATANRLKRPGLGIVLLDENEDPALLMRALENGFAAYVSQANTATEIVSVIRHAHVCPTSFAAPGLADAIHAIQTRESLLSAREHQVLMLIRDGHSSAAVADRLHLSESSVKTYVTRIYAKLDVSNRSQALVAAQSRGLLPGITGTERGVEERVPAGV
jgi:DNA-binding NarL/FixJ family response regulator